MKTRLLATIALAALAFAGVVRADEAAKMDSKPTAVTNDSNQAAAPTDPQIAGIVVAANQVDIDAGKFAMGHTKDKAVKEFAKDMVRDHTAVNKQAVALVSKLKVKPQDSATSTGLLDGGKGNLAHLKTLKGAEFDKAYVDHEVTYHQTVLDAIDQTLIPSAQNPELKALLTKTRPAIEAHLNHAKHIQSKMSGST